MKKATITITALMLLCGCSSTKFSLVSIGTRIVKSTTIQTNMLGQANNDQTDQKQEQKAGKEIGELGVLSGNEVKANNAEAEVPRP